MATPVRYAAHYILLCLLLGCVLAGCDEPEDNPSTPVDMSDEDMSTDEQQDASTMPVPASPPAPGRLTGELVVDGMMSDVSAIFTQSEQGSTGAVIVSLEDEDVLALTLIEEPARAGEEDALEYRIDAACPSSGNASSCTQLSESLDSRRAVASRDATGHLLLDFSQDQQQERGQLTLRSPGQVFEPHDGFRPQGDPDAVWPPRLEDRPDERLIEGIWSGHLLSLSPGFMPSDPLEGGACSLSVYDAGDLSKSYFDCSIAHDFDSNAYFDNLTTYLLQSFESAADLSSMQFEIERADKSTWRFDGVIWSEVVTLRGESGVETRHRLYHYDGTVEQEDALIGMFAFVSWGDVTE